MAFIKDGSAIGRVLKDFFHLLTANYFMSFFTLFSQIIVAWWLTAEDIGRIKILQSILNIAAVIAAFGFDTSTIKLCSMNYSNGERLFLFKKARFFVIYTIIATYLLLYLAALCNLLSRDLLVNKYAPFYLLTLIPLVLFNVHINYLEATKKFKLIASSQTIVRFIAVLILLTLTFFFHINGYIAATVFNIGILAIIFFILVKTTTKNIKTIFVSRAFFMHWKYAKYAIPTNIITQILIVTDILIINYLIKNRNLVGQYSFATLFIVGFNVILITIQQIVIPYVSEQSHDIVAVKNIVNKYTKLLRLLSFVLLIAGALFVPIFIHLFFNGKYDQSIFFFLILLCAFFFKSLRVLQLTTMIGMGFFNWVLYINITMLSLNLIITFLFVKLFYVNGAALAQLCVALISWILISFVYKKTMQIKYQTQQ